MSSATRFDPSSAAKVFAGVIGKVTDSANFGDAMARIKRLGMSPRQMHLNKLFSYYMCSQYDARKTSWDGSQQHDELEHEVIASAGFIPPGFYDQGGAMLPLKFRRPTAPYHLCKVIVERFTSMLFSERKHPRLRMEGMPDIEDFVHAMVEEARLWPAMVQARNLGGATGTSVISFKFLRGKPVLEIHDPRWTTPDFLDRNTQELRAIEIRYMYPREVRDAETHAWKEEWYWYRRIIDENRDIIFAPAPVGKGEEPDWEIAEDIVHGHGFCPVQWIQNMPVMDGIDGNPDCHGVYDQINAMDALVAQAHRGIISNSDPTLGIITDAEMDSIKKGSDNSIKLPKGSSASYIEISGSGPKAAVELAEVMRKMILEVAQVVLEHPDGNARTATEIERMYSSMISKADVLREQYGERGIRPLVEKMVRAAAALDANKELDKEGNIVKYALTLPPKVVTDEAGNTSFEPRILAADIVANLLLLGALRIDVSWPGYFEPGVTDAMAAAQAASLAKAGGLIDDEAAISYTAPFFNVEDIRKMVDSVRERQDREQADFESMSMGAPDDPQFGDSDED